MIIQKFKDELRRSFINYIKSTYLIYHRKKKNMKIYKKSSQLANVCNSYENINFRKLPENNLHNFQLLITQIASVVGFT